MSNLGLQSVYAGLNACDRVVAERFFVPGERYRESNNHLPWLSEESRRPLRDFDLIVFSISFESDYQNVIKALDAAGLSLRAKGRRDQEPIVLAGGIATQINPEPIAPFVDAFLLGDLEAIEGPLISCLHELTDQGLSRPERLRRLADTVPGVYIPSEYRPLYDTSGDLIGWDQEGDLTLPVLPAIFIPRPGSLLPPVPHTRILSPDSTFSNMFLMELVRGCGKGCRFCAAGFVYRPPRRWPLECINAALEELKGTDRIGLVGLEFLRRKDLERLCVRLLDRGLRLAFSSLRADDITQDFVRLLRASDTKVATIAPEAGSQRMRDIINKNLDEDAILGAAEMLVSGGIPNLKLYFMLGLPTETDEDVEDITGLVDKIQHTIRPIGRSRRHLGIITVSVTSFVPKAWTPMQWASAAEESVLRHRRQILQRALHHIPNVRLRLDSVREARFQAIVSRGDRRLAPVLEAIALRGINWRQAIREARLSEDMFCRTRDLDAPLPWEVLRHRVQRRYLEAEWKRAIAADRV